MGLRQISSVFGLVLAVFALALGAFGSALAQPPASKEGWRFGLGGGALLSPAYEGDDAYRVSLLPSIRINYAGRFFASVEDGIGYAAVDRGGLRAGPIARIRFGRREDGDQAFSITGEAANDLIGLGDVGVTAELGGFASYDVGDLTAEIETRKGVNGHEGLVAEASLRYGGRNFSLGPPLIYSVGPRIKFVGDNYNDAYFSVTPAQSAASGLAVYDADGGLHSYGLGATLIVPLSRDDSMSMIVIAGYDRLAGDAADAPLVVDRGSRDQASLGLFFSYWFR